MQISSKLTEDNLKDILLKIYNKGEKTEKIKAPEIVDEIRKEILLAMKES
ncbi:hypothetical protein [Evansella clarkii]|nr:hypothetical protein [Evansella clarkii]